MMTGIMAMIHTGPVLIDKPFSAMIARRVSGWDCSVTIEGANVKLPNDDGSKFVVVKVPAPARIGLPLAATRSGARHVDAAGRGTQVPDTPA